jgi:hypothetical protein
MDTPTPTPQEVQDLLAEMQKEAAVIARLGINGWGNLLANAAAALSAYQQEVERLADENARWLKRFDKWNPVEEIADARRAAFAEAAQMARDMAGWYQTGPAGEHREVMQLAFDQIANRLAAQAVPSGFCASCTPDIRPQCESASWCMRPQAVPPGATEE